MKGVIMSKNEDLIVKHGDIQLDFNNIELNKVYKNWREVCECLDLNYEDYKWGNPKKYLLKKIDLLVEYEQGVNTTIDYKFTKYKSKPLISLAGMREKNKIVKLALVNNIARYVTQNPDSYSNTIVFSWDSMMRTLGMVNKKYVHYKSDKSKLTERLGTNQFVTEEFFEKSKATLQRSVEAALKSLQNDGALIWYPSFRIWYREIGSDKNEVIVAEDEDIKLVLEAGDLAYEYIYDRYVTKPNDDSEEYDFDTKKRKAIGYMTVEDKWYLYYDRRNIEFSKIWNSEHKDMPMRQITGIYKVIKIIENMYRFKKYGNMLDNYDFDPYKVTDVMQGILMRNADNRHDKAMGEIEETVEDTPSYMIQRAIGELSDKTLENADSDFAYNFWCTVKYCMEDAYDADHIIREMNI
jgi:hypothetical protein